MGKHRKPRNYFAWGVLTATTVGAFSIGFFPTMANAADPTATPTVGVETTATPALNKAAVPSPVTPGAFCAKADHWKYGQSADGDWYQCRPDATSGKWHWKPTTSPTPKPATKPATKSPEPKQTTKAPVAGDVPTLPRTGSGNIAYVAGVGVVVVVAGTFIAFMTRTRRVRVEAPDDGS